MTNRILMSTAIIIKLPTCVRDETLHIYQELRKDFLSSLNVLHTCVEVRVYVQICGCVHNCNILPLGYYLIVVNNETPRIHTKQ